MTLREFIDLLGNNPFYLLIFFLLLPFTAILSGYLGKGEGHLSPWKYLYSILVYLACIPGVFAIAFSVYLFLFERRSIFDTDIFTQIVPIVAMFITLFNIRNNVDLDAIPGFDKISGLITIISATLIFMWLIDRTHIIAFAYIPFYQLLLIFIALVLFIRYGWSKIFNRTVEHYPSIKNESEN